MYIIFSSSTIFNLSNWCNANWVQLYCHQCPRRLQCALNTNLSPNAISQWHSWNSNFCWSMMSKKKSKTILTVFPPLAVHPVLSRTWWILEPGQRNTDSLEGPWPPWRINMANYTAEKNRKMYKIKDGWPVTSKARWPSSESTWSSVLIDNYRS